MDSHTPLSKILVHGVTSDDSGLQGRCSLVKEQFLAFLKERSKRLYRMTTSSTLPSQPSPETDNSSQNTKTAKNKTKTPTKETTKNNETAQSKEKDGTIAIVQLFLVQPGTALVSLSTTSHILPSSLTLSPPSLLAHAPRYAGYGWTRPFPWEGGLTSEIPTPPESKNPPSRAYRKFDEILAAIGENPRPHARVVDLGSAPGGWTYRLAKDLVSILFFILFPSIILKKKKCIKFPLADIIF